MFNHQQPDCVSHRPFMTTLMLSSPARKLCRVHDVSLVTLQLITSFFVTLSNQTPPQFSN